MADTVNGLKMRGDLKRTQSEVGIRLSVAWLGWTILTCKAFLSVSARNAAQQNLNDKKLILVMK